MQPVTWVSTSPTAPWQQRQVDQAEAVEPGLWLDGAQYQAIVGFGGCFNELGWDVLEKLPEDSRAQVLRSLFDTAEGCAFSWGRIPIGASDYALAWYSHNEVDGDLDMQHFSIERDQRYLLPFIRAAQQVQPDLRFFASPWSPPTWLKFPRAYNYGKIRWEPEILRAYALYLLRFAQTYRAEGVPVEQIHVQNEPDSDQKFPSCRWSGAELRDFIRDYLGPLFTEQLPDCEIWAGTLERGEYNSWANVILSDPGARRFVRGVGYQWAGKGAVQRTHLAWPELPIFQTENECGDGQNSWEYARYVFELMHHYLINGANGYMYWNMVLAPGGLSTWGWKQNSMICVDPRTGEVTYNPEYYVMKHFAHFIRPGAVRLGLRGPWAGNALAFRNPNGETVLVIANPLSQPGALCFENAFAANLEPGSIHTVVFAAQ